MAEYPAVPPATIQILNHPSQTRQALILPALCAD